MNQQQKLKTGQKTVLLSLQRVSYSLKRKLLTITALTSLGIMGRVALQFVPSVEPLTPLSILTGFLLGPISGFFSGVSGFYLSNYLVWGGQGPWTIFQCLGAGLAGLIGGIIGKFGKKSRLKLILSTFIGITLYEIIVTIPMGILFSFPTLMIYVLTSIPFSLVHLSSSIGFSLSFYEFKNYIKKLRGGRIDKEILGFRSVDSGDSKFRHKLVPFLYYKSTRGGNKSKRENRFWYVRKKQDD